MVVSIGSFGGAYDDSIAGCQRPAIRVDILFAQKTGTLRNLVSSFT